MRGIIFGVPVVPLELSAYSRKENWGASETFYASAVIDETTVNRVDVTGDAVDGTVCLADDTTT